MYYFLSTLWNALNLSSSKKNFYFKLNETRKILIKLLNVVRPHAKLQLWNEKALIWQKMKNLFKFRNGRKMKIFTRVKAPLKLNLNWWWCWESYLKFKKIEKFDKKIWKLY